MNDFRDLRLHTRNVKQRIIKNNVLLYVRNITTVKESYINE